MFVVLFIVTIFVLIFFLQSIKIVKEDQRAVLIRLGKFERVINPGLILIIPTLDRLIKVDLNQKIPMWRGLSKEQLENKVKEVVLGKASE